LVSAIGALVATALYSELHSIIFTLPDGTVMLPFLPLMVISTVCAIVILVSWSFSLHQMYRLCIE
jgi:hypothetical protein